MKHKHNSAKLDTIVNPALLLSRYNKCRSLTAAEAKVAALQDEVFALQHFQGTQCKSGYLECFKMKSHFACHNAMHDKQHVLRGHIYSAFFLKSSVCANDPCKHRISDGC